MYRRRRSRPSFFIFVLGAILAGVIFVIMDNEPPSPSEADLAVIPTVDTGGVDTPMEIIETSSLEPETETETDFAVDSILSEEVVAEASPLFVNTVPDESALFIPSAGIYAPIVQAYLDGVSWDVSRLGTNVGHLQGTSWVDENGNVVLSGHVELSDGRPGVFANLNSVVVGDVVVILVGDVQWRYVVTEISATTPDDLSPVYPAQDSRLTLITCDDYDFFRNAYLERIIIVAERIS